ncbi:ArsA family ATPase [Streptomyces sp. NPDC060194]|uniref:ArsA family ATPase n=1 Tax=Streptomyces sp. NPDC060194 TaxID=3347069 RepID=UPI003667646E
MRTRTVLVTGTGGGGRTTVAAATAVAGARRGERVLLLTTGPDPVGEAVPGLDVARIDSGEVFRGRLLALQERAGGVLETLGAEPLEPGELTTLPGAAEFALLSVPARAGGAHDLVVVDMPPLADTVAALALPEQLRRYLRRLLPPERQAARALRPLLAQLAGVPMPAQGLYQAAARWDAELAAAEAFVADADTSVRIVLEPGPAATEALRTGSAALALYGLRPDAVIANRLLPTASPDPWLSALAAQQQAHLKTLHTTTGDDRIVELPHLGHDPRPGAADLDRLAHEGPPPRPALAWPVEDRRAAEGVLLWRIPLPAARREELGLVRRGDELVLDVAGHRRIVPLPPALRRCTVSGAALADGELRIRCTPDPGLWPRTP